MRSDEVLESSGHDLHANELVDDEVLRMGKPRIEACRGGVFVERGSFIAGRLAVVRNRFSNALVSPYISMSSAITSSALTYSDT